MNDETLRALGKLVPEGMQRDAVHIAVVPVVAGVSLRIYLKNGRIQEERTYPRSADPRRSRG